MITEDYVSFETAKLLKEKRFAIPCNYAYNNKAGYFEVDISNFDEIYCFRPSLAVAMKWLRKVYNWTICISPYWPEGDMRNKLTWYYDIHSLIDNRSFRESSYTDSYTKVCETAIKYCLENLI